MRLELDPASVAFVMTITVLVVAVIFLVDTFSRRDTASGRMWAFAFLALAVSAVGHLAEYTLDDDVRVAAALGKACTIGFFAGLCIGMRQFNHRPIRVPAIAGVLFALLSVAGVAIAAWTDAELVREVPVLAGTAVLATWAAIEARRGALARRETVLLALALIAVAVFSVIALVALAIPALREGPLVAVFAKANEPLLTMPLALIALTTMMLLRASSPEETSKDGLVFQADEFLDLDSFKEVVTMLAARADRSQVQIAVVAMVASNLPEIGHALGYAAKERMRTAWRSSWVQHSPFSAVHGAGGDDCLMFLLPASSLGEANRIGNRVYGRVVEDLAAVDGLVLPVTGFGIALSGNLRGEELVEHARAAALRATTSLPVAPVELSVDDVLERTLPPRD